MKFMLLAFLAASTGYAMGDTIRQAADNIGQYQVIERKTPIYDESWAGDLVDTISRYSIQSRSTNVLCEITVARCSTVDAARTVFTRYLLQISAPPLTPARTIGDQFASWNDQHYLIRWNATLLSLSSDRDADKTEVLRLIAAIDREMKEPQPAGGAYVSPAAGDPSAHP